MERSSHLSTVLLATVLSPALLVPIDCASGNPALSSLELEMYGQDLISGFSGSILWYSIDSPSGSAVLRADAVANGARIHYTLHGPNARSDVLGVGSGTTLIDVPQGVSSVVVSVLDGSTNRTYTVNVNGLPACGDGFPILPEECDDGNSDDGDGCASNCTLEPASTVVPVVCSNDANADIIDADYLLTVDPSGPVTAGVDFTATFAGEAVLPEYWLDAIQVVNPAGITEVQLAAISATVQARSGATGGEVLLTRTQPYANGRCALSSVSCNTDADCFPTEGDDCQEVFDVPILDGTGDACNACNALGGDKITQCANSGFCVAGSLSVPLEPAVGSFTAGVQENVLFGWNEDQLPPFSVSFGDPLGPNGVRWSRPLMLASECYMGTANAERTMAVPLADQELVAIPIVNEPFVCGDGIATLPEECDDGNFADGDGCASDCTVEASSTVVPMACRSNAIPVYLEESFELTVDPQGVVVPNFEFTVDLGAVATVNEVYLDVFQDILVGGLEELLIVGIQSTVAVRSGAVGPDVTLTRSQPYAAGRCSITARACTDDSDCVVDGGVCYEVVPLPTVDGTGDGCAACDALGDNKSMQCANNGFCIDGHLRIPLDSGIGTFTASDSSEVLFGWAEGLPIARPAFADSLGPNGVRIVSAILFSSGLVQIGYECSMGRPVLDGDAGSALLDADLVAIPIVTTAGP